MSNATGLRLQGDTVVRFLELTDKDPWITDGSADTVEQIRGAGLVPKRALDVMECEVNRLLVLSSHAVVPLPYIVPRKVSVCLSSHLSICPYVHLFVHTSIHLSVYLSINLSVHVAIHLSVCLSAVVAAVDCLTRPLNVSS